MLVFVLFGGFFTVSASKTSLPGDALYSVKMVSESVELAVASKDVRAEVQIRQAGVRLEEISEISKKPSDINQGEKLKQLATSFEEKINNAQSGLAQIADNGQKAKTARVINVQTEKYTEVLAVAKENLTAVVQEDVSEKLAQATDSNKKVNLNSLAVRVELMTYEDKPEITAIIKGKTEEKETLDKATASSEAEIIPEAKAEPTKVETVVDAVEEMPATEEVVTPEVATIEQSKEKLMNLLENLSDKTDIATNEDTATDKEPATEENPPIEEPATQDGKVKGETTTKQPAVGEEEPPAAQTLLNEPSTPVPAEY